MIVSGWNGSPTYVRPNTGQRHAALTHSTCGSCDRPEPGDVGARRFAHIARCVSDEDPRTCDE
jgi:hypothetical protein